MFPTADILAKAVGCGRGAAVSFERPLRDACALFDITTTERLVPFLATIGHESSGLSRTVENLNYSTAERIVAVFRKFDTDKDRVVDPEELALARKFVGNGMALANFVYGGRLGNSAPNDGWDFRGRGLIQVTGRANYEAIRDTLRERARDVPDFLAQPSALAEPRWAAMSAAAYWHDNNLNELADAGDFRRICLRVNGGTNGMNDRLARYAKARAALS